jgi:hypothetical protein
MSTVEDLEGSGRGLIEILSRHLTAGTEENHEDLIQDSRYLSLVLKRISIGTQIGNVTCRSVSSMLIFMLSVIHKWLPREQIALVNYFYISARILICNMSTKRSNA